ncbi:MAG: hypothetical protein ABIR18_11065, partial [Chitinophagaceae bacterium]
LYFVAAKVRQVSLTAKRSNEGSTGLEVRSQKYEVRGTKYELGKCPHSYFILRTSYFFFDLVLQIKLKFTPENH